MEQFIDNLPPMDLMRSEKMTFVQLIIPIEYDDCSSGSNLHPHSRSLLSLEKNFISSLSPRKKKFVFVISGGEDCKLRLWSIKSGELLFEDKFSDSVIFIVCYKTYGHSFKAEEENQYQRDSSQGAWLGSLEGLFYMCWL
ncbi:V-type proton ATPase subunit a1 [Glycine max]|nr:V-type proton ATPase subunit a1 [Glycine max]